MLLRRHKRALKQLLLDFEFFLEDVGTLNLFSVTSRLKEFDSAARKARALGISIEDLQDLAGIRIVVSTQQEVEIVARFFSRQQDSKDFRIESDNHLSRKDGYRARHIVGVVQPRYSRSMYEARVEVQILTVFEHAFNFLSRAWFYKSPENLPAAWRERFVALSEQLRSLDKSANRLHSEVLDSAQTLADDSPVTPMSYQRLVQKVFKEHIELSHAVDSCRFAVDYRSNYKRRCSRFFSGSTDRGLAQQDTGIENGICEVV